MADFSSDYAVVPGTNFDCNSTTIGWTGGGTFSGLSRNTDTVKEGASSLNLDGGTGLATWTNTVANPFFRADQTNLHFWLFYAKGKSSADAFVSNSSALQVRLFFGGTVQYAEYRLTQNGEAEIPFGWSLWQLSGTNYGPDGGERLTVTGTPGWSVGDVITGDSSGESATVTQIITANSEYLITHPTGSGFTASETLRAQDNATGTFGSSPDLTANVQQVQLRINWASNPNPALKMDYWFTGKEIQVTSGTALSPKTFADIQSYTDTNNFGTVTVSDVFIDCRAGIKIGGGTSPDIDGYLEEKEKFILFNQYSPEVKHNLTVEANSGFFLGEEQTGLDGVYPLNGCQLVMPANRFADIDVKEGGQFELYDVIVLNWKDIFLGDGLDSSTSVTLNKVEFDSCETVYFRANTLNLTDIEIYNNVANVRNQCAEMTVAPATSLNILVHDCQHGIYFRETLTIEEYFAQDNVTYDLGILEGKTVSIQNGVFDATKIIRQAT